MAIRPYLTFAGNAREAFTTYQEVFGGELVLLDFAGSEAEAGPPPPGVKPDAIMHGALMAPTGLLMGADAMGEGYQGKVEGMCVNVTLDTVDDAKRVFAALADGGSVEQELSESFFAPAFGMCTDRFGVPWMVMVEAETPAQ